MNTIKVTIIRKRKKNKFKFAISLSALEFLNIVHKPFDIIMEAEEFLTDLLEQYAEKENEDIGYFAIDIDEDLLRHFAIYGIKNRPIENSDHYKSVYVLLDDTGIIKIGISNNFEKRLSAIRTASGRNFVDMYCSEKSYKAYKIEKKLHKKYSKFRINGEWFSGIDFKDVVDSLIKEIASSKDETNRNN